MTRPLHPSTPGAPRKTARALRTAGAVLALAGLAAAPLVSAPPVSAAPAVTAENDKLASRFTLAVLPDTQFYTRYSASQFIPRYGSDPFRVQTKWLAEHQDELKIPFATHLGDIVDQVGVSSEWQAADVAMKALEEASLDYSILPGNHDVRNPADHVTDIQYDLTKEPFLDWFGPDRAATTGTYRGSDPTGLSQYHVFEAEGQKYLVLAMTWRASDQTIAWANDVIAANPTVPVILTTHSLIDIENDGVTAKETDYGLKLWNDLISVNDQIFLTLNGHFHGAAKQTKLNSFGHPVTQIVIDYQMAYDGGNGYLGLLEFDLTNDRINVQTASPWVTFKPQASLTAFDQPFLEGQNQQFAIEIDFRKRFAGFAPKFSAGEPTTPSLSQAARDILLDGFVGPDPITTERPGSTADYPHAEGTLAHWRFNGLDGVLAEGAAVPDVAGENDMHRVPIATSGSPTATIEDVTITHDVHPLSSDGAAVCFADSDKRTNRLSFLSTDPTAPVNNAQFANGYTIETFLKIDDSFTEDSNAWMKALVRSGNRSKIPGMPWTRWDYTASPVALGLSNLKEFQWTELPIETTKGDRTAWSGEIILDRWLHVAIVNEPADHTTTMYVDGAPVLRNTVDTLGHSLNPDMPWLIGTDWIDDQARQGWNGCVGETRVIDRPTGPAEWLTSRADLVGLKLSLADSMKKLDRVEGSGLPGATVRVTVASGEDVPGKPQTETAQAVVDADGAWSINLDRKANRPGTYSVTAEQSLGKRAAEPVIANVRIAKGPAR